MELALGNYLTLRVPPGNSVNGPGYRQASDQWLELRFQNFWISQNAIWQAPGYPPRVHSFLPFGFSGAVISRQGDNIDASLVFPNTSVSRSFMDQAVRERWIAVIRVVKIENLEDPEQVPSLLYIYRGAIGGGGWTPTELSLTLNSVLDGVDTQLPVRSLNKFTVGNVPSSGSIALA